MFRGRRYKLARWFFGRPILPFAIEFLVLGPLVLVADSSTVAAGYLFLVPWLVLLFGVLNMPFVVAAFRAFRLDMATRRNHVLEHATIHYLEAAGARRLSGRAASTGFRVCGGSSVDEIKSAFEQVRRVIREGGDLPYVSARCGSNVVIALGLGLLLLSAVALGSIVVDPSLGTRASALTLVLAVFVAMRRGIGNWIQRRVFMAVDFDDVSLRDVRSIRPGLVENGPVHFVETIVRAKASTAV